ncbi:redoxin domain-containing protein [candidate division WOR-3 bacterium]|uniref:Redoxin domain-containing protein n=1 Tax=candidate division WOR-3 bacterium TaxID=2052148 RepID=A0A937XFX7_UNCW3|nr:redoxin domain-containing protein [candidate division WOR-3 bacterium]
MRSSALIGVPLVVFGLACNALIPKPDVGHKAPNFRLPDTAWVEHSLSEFRGKVVLLNFWQSG